MVLIEKEWIHAGHKIMDRGAIGGKKGHEYSPVFIQFLDCTHQMML